MLNHLYMDNRKQFNTYCASGCSIQHHCAVHVPCNWDAVDIHGIFVAYPQTHHTHTNARYTHTAKTLEIFIFFILWRPTQETTYFDTALIRAVWYRPFFFLCSFYPLSLAFVLNFIYIPNKILLCVTSWCCCCSLAADAAFASASASTFSVVVRLRIFLPISTHLVL